MTPLLLIFHLFATSNATWMNDPEGVEEELLCDDGSSAFDDEGKPNWQCQRRGCTPDAHVCWSEKIAHCRDAAGGLLSTCSVATEECNSRFSCFDLWLYCEGEYGCDESGGVGCKKGHCKTDTDAQAPHLIQPGAPLVPQACFPEVL